MAIGKGWAGLFEERNSLGSVQGQINQERKDRVNKAFQETVAAGGNLNAARVARANQQLAEALRGGVQNIFGSSEKGAFLPTDPRLTKAVDDDKHRQELTSMFKDKKMDNPQDFYLMAQEFYKRGFPKQAGELIAQGHGFRKETQAEKGLAIEERQVDTTLLSVENTHKIAKDNIQLKSQRLDLDKWASENNIGLNKAKFVFDQIIKKHGMKNADKLTNLQATKIRNDLSLGKARLNVTEKLGLGNLEVSKQNADVNEFNSRVNQVYGFEEQARKRMSTSATIRQADASLALKENLGLKAADVAQQTVDVSKRNAAVNEDRQQFAKFLGLEQHEYHKLSTDRLYEMAIDKQKFNQNISERGITLQEHMAEHRITQDGKEYDYKVYDSTRNHHLAQADFELRDRLGTAGMTLKQQDSIHRQWADEVNIKLKGDKQNFDQETTRQNQELLRDQFQWRKEFDTAGLNQRKIENLADQQLRGMSLELQEKGIDINRLNAQERIALATKEFAFKKFLGIAGLEDAAANRKLTRELAGNADKFKQQGIDLEKTSLGQKKELFNLELKQRGVLARMKDATIKSEGGADRVAALQKAKASLNPPKVAGKQERIGVYAMLETTPELSKKFEKKYGVDKPWNELSWENDPDEAVARFANDVRTRMDRTNESINEATANVLEGSSADKNNNDLSGLLKKP